jgi:hypothetical protein
MANEKRLKNQKKNEEKLHVKKLRLLAIYKTKTD